MAKKNSAKNSSPSAVVGVGASAGGLESFTNLLKHLPADLGLALIFVQHLDPVKQSHLVELLARVTPLKVVQAEDGMALHANHVFVIPPGRTMILSDGRLSLSSLSAERPHRAVDTFLQSLAQDRGAQAIGVILSGTGVDGSSGLAAVRAVGGVTFCEDSTAAYSGMPQSAVASGGADFVLPAAGIAEELARLARHPYLGATPPGLPPTSDDCWPRIFTLLRQQTGVNFSLYKPPTVQRRVMRRMVLHRLEQLEDYYQLLRQSPQATESLYQDLLISVTGLFRDPEVYQQLATQVVGPILDGLQPDQPVRVWVPGCSKGDEVYSIAITLLECLSQRQMSRAVQIFATDVNDQALEQARIGIYPESLSEGISADRLQRFFHKIDHGYQINKSVRDLCVFAHQDLTRDPPFSRLDLISCRNLLIYLNSDLQHKILRIFHYSLNPGGFLLLGASESLGRAGEFFVPLDRQSRIFFRRTTAVPMPIEAFESSLPLPHTTHSPEVTFWRPTRDLADVQKEADRLTLLRYTPPGVLLNSDLDIIQFRGRTGLFLEAPSGSVTHNVLKMAREGLLSELRSALQEASETGLPSQRHGVRVRHPGDWVALNLEVFPFQVQGPGEQFYLVIFQPVLSSAVPALESGVALQDQSEVSRLRQELEATREYLNSSHSEQFATVENLQAAHEELQSANEELQSTNEELETAKEELQSTNEELTTVNEELSERNLEMSRVNNDLNNLLASVSIPLVILGPDLRIRRFTPMARQILKVIPGDIGRPIGDLRPNLEIPELEKRIHEVLDTLCPQELDLQDSTGHWYSVRIRPYRTHENRIDGTVIVFLDVDQARRSLAEIQEARDLARIALEAAQTPLLWLDGQWRVREANSYFLKLFGLRTEDVSQQLLWELDGGRWNYPELRARLQQVADAKTLSESDLEVSWQSPRGGSLKVRIQPGQRYSSSVLLLQVEWLTPATQ